MSLEQLIVDLKESLEREIGEFRRETRERLDRIENRVSVISMDLANINRSLDAAARRELEVAAAQAAHQKAIDDLATRVTRLEQRLENRQ